MSTHVQTVLARLLTPLPYEEFLRLTQQPQVNAAAVERVWQAAGDLAHIDAELLLAIDHTEQQLAAAKADLRCGAPVNTGEVRAATATIAATATEREDALHRLRAHIAAAHPTAPADDSTDGTSSPPPEAP